MLVYSKAIGANTDVLTAQAFVFEEPSLDQLLVIAISGEGEEAFVRVRKVGLEAKEIFDSNHDSYGIQIHRLGEHIRSKLKDLEQLSAVITVVVKTTLYLETINQFNVLLDRQGRVMELTRGLEDQKLISGILETSDRVLFLSPPFSGNEDPESYPKLQSSLLSSKLENLEFELESFLAQQANLDPVAVVLLENPPLNSIDQDEQLDSPVDQTPEPPTVVKNHVPTLDGSRSRTPSFLLLVISFWQSLPLSKVKLLLILIFLVVVGSGLFFTKNQFFRLAAKPSPSVLPPPSNTLTLTSFPVFLDLNLVKDNFSGKKLSLSLGKMVLLDSNTKSLLLVDIASKQPQILAGTLQLGDAQFAGLNGDFVYVFSKDKGILKVDSGNGKTTVGVNTDAQWQKITDLVGFANNVYLLDEFNNQIWKYIATDKGFSDRSNYLREGEKADFAGVRMMQIDGNVWILKSDNTILKFVQGGSDFFQLGTIDPPLDSIKSFFVSDETDNLYFLDNEHSRVVVTNKKGEYQLQYSGDKFKTASDLVVDEKGKKLYLLESGKIYQVDLK